jgi:hypothetical protein
VSPRKLVLLLFVLIVSATLAQQPPQPPQVKLNVLNVCTPSAEEQKEISAALAKIPKQPLFAQDFEIDRGRSTLPDSPNFLQPGTQTQSSSDAAVAYWVRIRRELAVQALFSTVQYSFSVDPKDMVETLVFRVRDPKELMQVSIEDSASAVTSPAAMLSASTPVSRIKLERFGKSSVVLARCTAAENGPPPDQSPYEPLFRSATSIITNYRHLLAASSTVPAELARIGGRNAKSNSTAKSAPKKVEPK